MKSQAVLISAYIATAILILIVTVLFLRIYAYTTSYRIEEYGVNIFDMIRTRPEWKARALAEEILKETNAYYVKVNITVYDLLSGNIISQDYYEIRTIGVDKQKLNLRNYTYSMATGDAYVYIYRLEVGFR